MEVGERMNLIKSNNRIKSTHINYLRLFLKQFERIGVLIYFIVMILHLASVPFTIEDIIVYSVPLSMHLVLQISKALYFDYIKMKHD